MPTKAYTVRPEVPEDVKLSLGAYHPTLQKLLHFRGISTGLDAERFLHPDYDLDLHDPFLLAGMDKAVDRILTAVANKEKILIYSDYDADGIPGGVVLREFFEKIGHSNIENYIPHRHEEGYGVHMKAVEQFAKDGVQLLITIDCGIADEEPINRASALGIDVIVTDHHEPNGKKLHAFAVIDPKQKDCPYPFKELCGSGIVFKLIVAILSKNRFDLKDGTEKWFLDLVGIATLSDMVTLTGENRALAHYGLRVLQKTPRRGLQQLFKKVGVTQGTITEEDIVFSVTPRLNAASRMGRPQDTFNLLSTKDDVEAHTISEYLHDINNERKGIVAGIVADIHKHIKQRETMPKVFVIGNPNWKPALLGLVASRIQEDIQRPIFIWGRNDEMEIKGSCRSEGYTDLMALMEGAKDSFLQFGGHKMAGGFSVTNQKIHFLEEALNTAFEKLESSTVDRSGDVNWVDTELSIDNVNWDTYRHVEQLAPFGVGNPKPLFLIRGAHIVSVKQFGKDKNHLEITFRGKNKPLKAISFFSKPEDYLVVPKEGMKVGIVGTLEKSNFRNFPELRFRIVDIIE